MAHEPSNYTMIDKIAQNRADSMELEDLLAAFKENQADVLQQLSPVELRDVYEDEILRLE